MRAASWGSARSLCSCSVAQVCIVVPLQMLDKDSFVGLCKPLLFPYPALVLGIMQFLSTRVSSQARGEAMCPGGTDPARLKGHRILGLGAAAGLTQPWSRGFALI